MLNNARNVMNSVKINKRELLDIVVKNKETHIKEYSESIMDYIDAVLKIAQDNLKIAKTGIPEKFDDIKHIPTKPVSYADSYTRAIRMLELSVDDVIELEQDVFNQLVLDEWNWKHNFILSNATYKSFK